MSATYLTPDMSQPWVPDPALVCPDCGWAPPPYYRYGVKGQENKPAWAGLYREHRVKRLCPQYRAMNNEAYIRFGYYGN